MKKLIINVYQLHELKKQEKEHAIETNNEIVLQNSHEWYEFVYEDFKQLMKCVGVEVSNIFFNGFGSQGSGSTFENEIKNFYQFIKNCKEKKWTKHAPNLKIKIPTLTIETKTLNMIKNKTLQCKCTTTCQASNYLTVHIDYCLNKKDDCIDNNDPLIKEFIKIEKWTEKVLDELNDYLFQSLQQEYDYLLQNKVVEEYLSNNDCLFDHTGQLIEQRILNVGKLVG